MEAQKEIAAFSPGSHSESFDSDMGEISPDIVYVFSDLQLAPYQLSFLKNLNHYIKDHESVMGAIKEAGLLYSEDNGAKVNVSFSHEVYGAHDEKFWADRYSRKSMGRAREVFKSLGGKIPGKSSENDRGMNWQQELVWESLGYVIGSSVSKISRDRFEAGKMAPALLKEEMEKMSQSSREMFTKLLKAVDGNPFESADGYLLSADFKQAVVNELKLLSSTAIELEANESEKPKETTSISPRRAVGFFTGLGVSGLGGGIGIAYRVDPKGTTEVLTDPRVFYTAIAIAGAVLGAALVVALIHYAQSRNKQSPTSNQPAVTDQQQGELSSVPSLSSSTSEG